MTYDELVNYFKDPRKDYYEQLLINAETILKAYRTRTQAQLGEDLNMSQSKMSVVIKMLIAYTELCPQG